MIASATLTVNEFHAMTLATGNPESKWSRTSLIAIIILLILLAITLLVALFYIFCVRRRSKSQIAEMEQFIGPIRKRVIYFLIYVSLKYLVSRLFSYLPVMFI